MSELEAPEMIRRREVLRRAAWILGGAISAPAALAILQGCSAKDEPKATEWQPKFFKGDEAKVVTAIADIFCTNGEAFPALVSTGVMAGFSTFTIFLSSPFLLLSNT